MLNNCDSCHPGLKLFKQLQPLSAERIFETRKPSHVAAWLCEALDKASSHGIGDLHEHDRDRAKQRLHHSDHCGSADENHVWWRFDELCGGTSYPFRITSRKSNFDVDIDSFDPAQRPKRLMELCQPCLANFVTLRKWQERANAPRVLHSLLRKREERRT
jgi:hypothetical protein